jgi:tRNA (guanine-N7-)-methyltransferase
MLTNDNQAPPKSIKRSEEHLYRADFNLYNHDNPYHEKLKAFEDFVILDQAAESHYSQWRHLFQAASPSSPLHIEIGTGYGDFMLDFCQHHPDILFIGLDHRFKRSFSLAKKLASIPNKNFRYLRAKGERLAFIFGPGEVDCVYFFFPDPWPKKRHHKKRLFQKPFLESVQKVLKPGGRLVVKTDHEGYFDWMLNEIALAPIMKPLFQSRDLYTEFPDHPLTKFKTKFEKIFLEQRIPIKALVLENDQK